MNSLDNGDNTPLHYAAASASISCIASLLERKANPIACDIFGRTPLHVIAGKSTEPFLPAAGFLIDHCDGVREARDLQGRRAEDVARWARMKQLISEGVSEERRAELREERRRRDEEIEKERALREADRLRALEEEARRKAEAEEREARKREEAERREKEKERERLEREAVAARLAKEAEERLAREAEAKRVQEAEDARLRAERENAERARLARELVEKEARDRERDRLRKEREREELEREKAERERKAREDARNARVEALASTASLQQPFWRDTLLVAYLSEACLHIFTVHSSVGQEAMIVDEPDSEIASVECIFPKEDGGRGERVVNAGKAGLVVRLVSSEGPWLQREWDLDGSGLFDAAEPAPLEIFGDAGGSVAPFSFSSLGGKELLVFSKDLLCLPVGRLVLPATPEGWGFADFNQKVRCVSSPLWRCLGIMHNPADLTAHWLVSRVRPEQMGVHFLAHPEAKLGAAAGGAERVMEQKIANGGGGELDREDEVKEGGSDGVDSGDEGEEDEGEEDGLQPVVTEPEAHLLFWSKTFAGSPTADPSLSPHTLPRYAFAWPPDATDLPQIPPGYRMIAPPLGTRLAVLQPLAIAEAVCVISPSEPEISPTVKTPSMALLAGLVTREGDELPTVRGALVTKGSAEITAHVPLGTTLSLRLRIAKAPGLPDLPLEALSVHQPSTRIVGLEFKPLKSEGAGGGCGKRPTRPAPPPAPDIMLVKQGSGRDWMEWSCPIDFFADASAGKRNPISAGDSIKGALLIGLHLPASSSQEIAMTAATFKVIFYKPKDKLLVKEPSPGLQRCIWLENPEAAPWKPSNPLLYHQLCFKF